MAAIIGDRVRVDSDLTREVRAAFLALLIAMAAPALLMIAGSNFFAPTDFALGSLAPEAGAQVQASQGIDVQLSSATVERVAAPRIALSAIESKAVTTTFTIDTDTAFRVVAMLDGKEVSTQVGSTVAGERITATVLGLLPSTDYSLVVILGDSASPAGEPIWFRTAR